VRRPAALLVACALLPASCGGEEPSTVEPLPFRDLIGRVPAGEPSAVVLDVSRARVELGLAADAAPPAPPATGNDGERRLRGLVSATVLNYPIRDDGPLDRAIDYRQVTGLLRANGPPEVLVVATRQPWADLRAALERHGWRARPDGVLERPAVPGARVLRWVAGRDGLAVAAGDARTALRLRDGTLPTSRSVRDLLAAVDGPARAARIDRSRCIRGVAAGYSPGAGGGEFTVVVPDVPPLPYRLRTLPGRPLPAGYAASSPRAAGGRVQVPFSFEASTDPAVQPVTLALASSGYFAYRCRGA
jgi:hypothetical protein